MIVGQKKPSLDDLFHFGVKGMKWGIRNAENSAHPNYTSEMRTQDRQMHGKRAVTRINNALKQGVSRAEALRREEIRNSRQRLAVAGAAIAVNILVRHGAAHVSDFAANRASASRSDSFGIGVKPSKIPYIKPGHNGVHKITTMK